MPATKLMSMRDAVAAFVPDGASVCMGTALEAAIPFAAGHELIRQRRRDLELVGPISDMLFDQLVAAGCVRKITAAWVGNVSAGLGHAYRRAAEKAVPRAIEVEDHSNFTLALALQAAAIGAPYIPTRSLLGTGLLESNPRLRRADDPFSGRPLVLVPALAPDVAIVHVQRADGAGHAHAWGTLGVTREAVRAAGQVIVVAEEIRPRDDILRDPTWCWRRHSRSPPWYTSPSAPIRRPCKGTTGATTSASMSITTRRAPPRAPSDGSRNG